MCSRILFGFLQTPRFHCWRKTQTWTGVVGADSRGASFISFLLYPYLTYENDSRCVQGGRTYSKINRSFPPSRSTLISLSITPVQYQPSPSERRGCALLSDFLILPVVRLSTKRLQKLMIAYIAI